MIWIMRVGTVMCSRCGHYLEGVEAVFAGHPAATALCWQDFELRAMRRQSRPRCCLDDLANWGPTCSLHCNCPYQKGVSICESDGSKRGSTTTRTTCTTHSESEGTAQTRSEGVSHGFSQRRTS